MSRSLPQAGDNRQILEEASAWFVEFRVSECDEGTRSRFAQWLRSSPEHIRAYMEITGVYAHLLSPKSLQTSDIESLIARVRSRSSTVIPISELVPPRAAPQSASAA